MAKLALDDEAGVECDVEVLRSWSHARPVAPSDKGGDPTEAALPLLAENAAAFGWDRRAGGA